MCDYSMHAVASRPAQVGETLVTTTFRGTSTRGFASESDPGVAVCMLPGTELAFEEEVKYDNRWIWTRTINSRVGKFGKIDPHIHDRHHDAIEFPDGSFVLVTSALRGTAGERAAIAGDRAGQPARANNSQRDGGKAAARRLITKRAKVPPAGGRRNFRFETHFETYLLRENQRLGATQWSTRSHGNARAASASPAATCIRSAGSR